MTIAPNKDEALDIDSVFTSLPGELLVLIEVVEIISQIQPDASHSEKNKDTTRIQAPE